MTQYHVELNTTAESKTLEGAAPNWHPLPGRVAPEFYATPERAEASAAAHGQKHHWPPSEYRVMQGSTVIPPSGKYRATMPSKGLPTDDASRKGLPIFRGPLMYFPDAMLALAAVCKVGNDQHNPGQPLHWAREKSTEQMDTALRHMIDHGLGNTKDVDGTYHMAKAVWRCLAELQLTIEKDRA